LQTVTENTGGSATLLKADGTQWKISGARPQGGLTVGSEETTYFACGNEFCREFMTAEADGTGALRQWGLDGMRAAVNASTVEFFDASGRRTVIKLKMVGERPR